MYMYIIQHKTVTDLLITVIQSICPQDCASMMTSSLKTRALEGKENPHPPRVEQWLPVDPCATGSGLFFWRVM